MDLGARLISFDKKEDDAPFLLDENDIAYLELTKTQIENLRFQFNGYYFYDPDIAMKSIVSYCYENWMFAAKVFLGVDMIPFQGVVIQEFFDKSFYIFVATRGAGKSFLLAVYALLRAIFKQGSKIVIVSASFRQSQIVFNYIQDIYKNSIVLQQICGSSRPKKDVSMCSFQIGNSSIISVPLGTGEKIRGLRGNCVDGNTLIETNKGLIRIKDTEKYMCDETFRIYTGNSKEQISPDYFMKTKPIDGYEVKLECGYSLVCSYLHGIHTVGGVKEIKDLEIGDKLIVENNYEFPFEYVEKDGIVVDEKIGWMLGALVSEGCVSRKHTVCIHCTDIDYLDRFEECLKYVNPNKHISKYQKDGYIDKRGWDCKPSLAVSMCDVKFREKLVSLGLERKRAKEKSIPWCILQSPKSVVVAFMSALFEGDGTCFHYKDKIRDNCLGVAYYSGSTQLIKEVHILLRKFGFLGSLCSRKSKISDKLQYSIRLYGRNPEKFCELVKIKKWDRLYNTRCTDINYIKERTQLKIKSIEKLSEKRCFYDYTIPNAHSFMGNCIKNRNCILTDEFSAVAEEIFQVVVRGFSVVALDPVGKVKAKYREKDLIAAGVGVEFLDENNDANQIILTGTAYYQFNHFYEWYMKYKSIIECGNDREKLRKIVGDEVSEAELDQLNPNKFGVMKVPYYYLPAGYIDEGIIAQSKATMTKAHFNMEFNAEFYADSDGFFPASLVDAVSMFAKYSISMSGEKDKKYIMGVDPARQADHFSIVLIEVDEGAVDRRHKAAYAWATNEKKMKKSGEVNENQTYYGACAKKIRQLMSRFNVVLIMMDAGGGGREIANYLQEKRFLREGEKSIWEIDEPSQSMYEGIHILKLIASNSAWVSDANHSMKKSIEEFRLLFPIYDTVAIEGELTSMNVSSNSLSKSINKVRNSMTDTVEDVNEEIEEMKKEITNIVITGTPSGNEHFDLPKMNLASAGGGKQKDKRRKDRYSACVLAHYGIQFVVSEETSNAYEVAGGTAEGLAGKNEVGAMYRGLPANSTQLMSGGSVVVQKAGGGKIVF